MKNIKKIALTSAMVLGTIASTSSSVFAATVDTKDSNAKVTFKAPTDGALTLKKVANLDFGEQDISASDETYTNSNEDTDTNTATVQDIRGSVAGWKVSVTQNGDFKNGASVLTGAKLTLDGTTDNGTTIVNGIDEGGKPVKGAVLVPGKAVDVWTAAKGQGNITTNMIVGKGSSSLFVPGETSKVAGAYTTTLTWTLDDAVANADA